VSTAEQNPTWYPTITTAHPLQVKEGTPALELHLQRDDPVSGSIQ